MKILYAINGLGTGGAEHSLLDLLEHLPPDIEAVVAALQRRDEGVEARVATRATVHYAPRPGLRSVVPWLRRLIARERPDLVHGMIFEADLAARLAAIGGPPVLTSLVNTSYEDTRVRADPNVSRGKLAAARLVDGVTARHLTDRFHAITQAVATAAVRDLRIRPDRITVIERGRDPERFRPPSPGQRRAARAVLGLDEDAEVVLNVARQEYQKGQLDLVRALPGILAARPQAVLVVAGRRGNASAALHDAIAGAGLGQAVRLLGHRDDVATVLSAADVFAFPSLYEGLGGAVIEAMACGLPLVLTDIPALREVAGPVATFVPAGQPAVLATTIADLLSTPERRRTLGDAARDEFEARFTLARSVERMVGLYEAYGSAGAASRSTR